MSASLILLGLSLIPQAANAGTITQDILACEGRRLVNPAVLCQSEDQARQELSRVCADPVKYVCTKAPPRGRFISSRCKINFNENSDAAQTPEVIGLNSKIKTATAAFLTRHQSECSGAITREKCFTSLKTKYTAELKKIQIDVVYTPERMNRITKMFNDVKQTAIRIIQDSGKVSAQDKPKLIKRLKETTLLDPRHETPNSCYYLGADGADTGIFNSIDPSGSNPSKVNFCMGAMAMLDREEESSVLWTLGHELTHSIDPCTMDLISGQTQTADTGDHFYQSMTKCLRGGTGPNGCTGGKLHCNDPVNQRAYCKDETFSTSGEAFNQCMKMTQKFHNCPFHGPEQGTMNLAQYRQGPGAVDQTQESFSDFFGAEIYGKLLKNQRLLNPMSSQEKIDLLAGLGTDFASLHGICLNQNTNDPHPPGEIRIKNNVLANPDFADAFCKGSQQKRCEGL